MRDLCLTAPFLLALVLTSLSSIQLLPSQTVFPPYLAAITLITITFTYAILITLITTITRILWRFNLEYRSRTGPSFRISTEDSRPWWQDPDSLEPTV